MCVHMCGVRFEFHTPNEQTKATVTQQAIDHLDARHMRPTGSWEGDQKSGLGIMQYANGDVYEGSWRSDVKTGQGVLKWSSTQQQYTGQWKGNKPDGLGTHLWFQAGAIPESPTHALLLMYNR